MEEEGGGREGEAEEAGLYRRGALVVVQGWLADHYGLQASFLLTAACELYVLFYALWGAKPVVAK